MASTPGRREIPLEGPADNPILIFAAALRALRDSIGRPPYVRLAKDAHYSRNTLSKAASGKQRPTWNVAEAYVVACRGDVRYFRRLYLSLFGSAR